MTPGPARSRAEGRTRLAGGVHGYTLLEALLVVTVLAIVTAVVVPSLLSSLDASRTRGAARYLAGRLYLARMEAAKRSVYVALRIEDAPAGYRYTFYADGNGDGVRSADIADNVDTPISPHDRLDEKFPGVSFGILDGITEIDSPGTSLSAGGDPVRFGTSNLLSFSPIGAATSGTFYIRGRGKQQMAVRVLGATGRIRVLRFDFRTGKWVNQ
jgi:type II secretory pathway pseudopilin PulG